MPDIPEKIWIRWLEDRGGHMNWCVVAGVEGDPEYHSAASVERLRKAAKIALVSLERLAKIDADDSGIDVELCEYKGTKELRDALADTDSSQEEEK